MPTADNTTEIWKPISELVGYFEVSNRGRIRRMRFVPISQHIASIVPKAPYRHSLNEWGYPIVRLSLPGGKKVTWPIHRIVAQEFIGPRPDGLQINHKDGNKKNNTPENLEYVSASENMRHADRMGLRKNMPKGEAVNTSKLKEEEVRLIRREYGTAPTREIALRHGVQVSIINKIVRRAHWKHI